MLAKKTNTQKYFPKQPDSGKDPLADLEIFDRFNYFSQMT